MLVQFLGLAFEMSQAGLPVFGLDGVIGAVSVGDENPGKMFAEDALGRWAGAVRVDLKEGQFRSSLVQRRHRVEQFSAVLSRCFAIKRNQRWERPSPERTAD